VESPDLRAILVDNASKRLQGMRLEQHWVAYKKLFTKIIAERDAHAYNRAGQGIPASKPSKKETQTTTGFLLSDRSAEAPKVAEVVAVGEDVTYAVGDSVIYKPYAMTEIKLDGVEHYLIEQIDVIGRLK
jgi:chaperonin GroES